MWLAVRVDTSAASNSFPTPLPGRPASLQITVSSDLFCLTNSSTRRSGVPTAMNSPTIIVAPLGIIATASSTETLLMLTAPMVTAANGLALRYRPKVGGRLNSPALICPRLASADNPFIGMQRRGVSRQQMQDLAQSTLRVGVELAGRCNGVGTETAERLSATIGDGMLVCDTENKPLSSRQGDAL